MRQIKDAAEGKQQSGRCDHGAKRCQIDQSRPAALRAYEDALKQALPADVRGLVEQQYREVRANPGRVREIGNAMA